MNILDVILIVINIFVVIGGIGLFVWVVKDAFDFVEGLNFGLLMLILIAFVMVLTFFLPFVVLDKGSGSTIGTITSVDKNFFGTTSVYIKTSETTQEKYCIESNDIVEKSKEMIGKKVKISYGERIGLYSTSKCHSAPIEVIEEVIE